MRVFPPWFRLTGGFPCQWERYGAVLYVLHWVGTGLFVSLVSSRSVHVPVMWFMAVTVISQAAIVLIWRIGRQVSKADVWLWTAPHCVACVYELPVDVREGRCPECGRAYVRDAVMETWAKRYPRCVRGLEESA